ncbi:MAG: V-type ATP synthase subunit I, partial [Treponema sp.]|nr:V-type ATP synthase subunit I [Treponema sp.]
PRKMKQIELTVLSRDTDAVIEFLGRRSLMQFSGEDAAQKARAPDEAVSKKIRETYESIAAAATWLSLPLPGEPGDASVFPGTAEENLANTITRSVSALSRRENELSGEKRKIEETLNEARAFANLNAPFSDLDRLSYLTLRVGRLDSRWEDELKENIAPRGAIIPLGPTSDGTGTRILAAASRRGRFALDSELRKVNFTPIAIPEGFKGVPSELLSGLETKFKDVEKELDDINSRRAKLREEHGPELQSLAGSYLMAGIIVQLKARLTASQSAYLLSGWVPADMVQYIAEELERITEGRIALRAFVPEEVSSVREGREKVPVSLKHGRFVKGFEPLVFSYGAPLYGTIDPTPVVAVFYTVLFGIMFGDVGQGIVLLILGFLTGKGVPAFFRRFRKFSVPLVAVGISSLIMGFVNGEFFTFEDVFVGPTRFITGLLTGHPVDRILNLLPLPEKGGSIERLFYFFGFTLSLGVLLNSAGLIINMVNLFAQKKYEKAIFTRTGLAGTLFFWYAIFIAVRAVLGMAMPGRYSFSLYWYDWAGLVVPLLGILLGPALWRLFSGERPVLEEGGMVFGIELFVDTLETVSNNISYTVSFVRVGVFALSHVVLSYIVFLFTEMVSTAVAGPLWSVIIFLFGNGVIIVLEGLIVAIQVVRLQYYEFFSKFFTETGVQFSPFRFNARSES